MPTIETRTDWQAVILTLLVPAVVVAGLVYLALQPQWEDSIAWLDGLVVLILFEGVRVIVLRIMRDTLREYRGPWQAVKFFLLSIAILAAICLVWACFAMGMQIFSALADLQTWEIILPPTAIIIVDGLISLVFFRGDPRKAAAQLEAGADDAQDWSSLIVFPTPLLVGVAYALLIFLRTRGVAIPACVPSPNQDAFREINLLYAAVYFSGKALLLAHMHSAHFMRSGRRVLGGRWIQLIISRNCSQCERNVAGELRLAERRLAVLRGEGVDAVDSKAARKARRRELSSDS